MGTPRRVPQERGRPVKYDVEAIQLKDYNDADDILNPDGEDKQILQSIAYAEKKLGAKMGVPEKIATRRGAPIMYDVEALSQKTKTSDLELGGMVSSKKEAKSMGDCDEKDFTCQAGEEDAAVSENASVSDLKHALQRKSKKAEKHVAKEKKVHKAPAAKKTFSEKMKESTQPKPSKHHHKKMTKKHKHHHHRRHEESDSASDSSSSDSE